MKLFRCFCLSAEISIGGGKQTVCRNPESSRNDQLPYLFICSRKSPLCNPFPTFRILYLIIRGNGCIFPPNATKGSSVSMNLKKLLLLIPLSGSLLVLTSCGDYIGKEKSHPFFVKAETSRNAGNYKEAAQYFEEFLNVCPRSPVVHYELGSLYTDHLNDPYKAVYHYQRYLELDRTSPDAENIRKFIDGSKRRIFEQLSTQFESADTARAYEEAEKTRKLLDQYVAYSKKLRAQNDTLRSQNDEMRKRIESFGKESEKFKQTVKELQKKAQEAQLLSSQEPVRQTAAPEQQEKQDPGKTNPAAPAEINPNQALPKDPGDEWENAKVAAQSPNSAAGEQKTETEKQPVKPVQPPPSRQELRRHTVQKGDTLSGIARKYYGKSSAFRLIRNANKDVLKGKDQLQIGQILVIPPDPATGEKKP